MQAYEYSSVSFSNIMSKNMVLTEPWTKKNSEIPVVSFLPHAMFNLSEKKNFHSRQTDMLKV